MPQNLFILAWLNEIPDAKLTEPIEAPDETRRQTHSKKRKTQHQYSRPLTPPTSTCGVQYQEHIKRRRVSASIMPGSQSRKRHRANSPDNDTIDHVQQLADDSQVTPRAPSSFRDLTRTKTPSLSSSRTGSQSQASGYSSPTKGIASMEINKSNGLQRKTLKLGDKDLPSSLNRLLLDVSDIKKQKRIIPAYLKDTIEQLPAAQAGPLYYVESSAYNDDTPIAPSSASRHILLEKVQSIVREAGNCLVNQHVESGWNHLVHTPLLQAAVETVLSDSSLQGLRMEPCMAAKINPDYLPTLAKGKMVDYVMCVDTSKEGFRCQEEIQQQRQKSLNHTDFFPLRNYPITFSVETKRGGGGEQVKADYQMITWLIAQWKFLATMAPDSVAKLEYIPGLIVIGHDWKLVATTYAEGQMTFWQEYYVGSTEDEVGVFQIMSTLQRLRRWALHDFWPWYRTNVLRSEGT